MDPGSVQILGRVKNSKSSENMTTSKKKTTKRTCQEKTSSKSSSSISSTGEDIKALYAKWSERFSRLETVLANTFQHAVSPPVFQQVTILVSPLKQPPTHVVTSERFFMLSSVQPVRPFQANLLPVPLRDASVAVYQIGQPDYFQSDSYRCW